MFHTEPTFRWRHKTPNLAEAIQGAPGACRSWGVLIPTCQASSTGNYISPQKSIPAAAVRCRLHFHLTKWSLELRSLGGWLTDPPRGGFIQGLAVFQHLLDRALGPGVRPAPCKELWLKEVVTCKVLLSPNLFLSSTPVIVMGN